MIEHIAEEEEKTEEAEKNFQFTTDKIANDDRISHYARTRLELLVELTQPFIFRKSL